MGKYLKKFSTHTEYDAYINGSGAILPNVSACIDMNEVHYNPYVEPIHDYSQDYLTIESLEDNNKISWKTSSDSLTKTISVSTDNGETWTDKKSTTSGVTLATLNTGDKLLVKGSNVAYANSAYYNYFVSTGKFNIEGNIMSMEYGDNFIGQTKLDRGGYDFSHLFYNCYKLISAENLILPATTMTQSCYASMFYGCTSLTTAPELPATTLAYNCYDRMFQSCTSLTTAPELPATTLASYCYQYMFEGCSSLITAPELPATTLSDYCYYYMFNGCTSLNSIKCLATDISDSNCTSKWVSNVAASGTFIKAASMTSWRTGISGIPSGWTVQDAA